MTVSEAAIETQLRRALPAERFSSVVDAFEVDGLRPSVVVAPTTADEVSAIVRAASEANAALIPWGSGARMALGRPPERYDVALDLRGLDQIVEYEPADLTVTVQAGVLLSTLQQRLATERQWLPLDPPTDGAIGGILAANDSGPARIVHGTGRDLVIGMQAVLGDGTVVNSGGRVVKNVAGYDLTKLQIGALGTLGVITQVALKVAPLPAQQETLTFAGSREQLTDAAFRIRDAALAVNGLALAARDGDWHLEVRLAGGASAVERSRREVETIARELSLTASESRQASTGDIAVRAGILPTASGRICDAASQLGADVLAYPTVGVVRATWMPDRTPRVDQIADLRRLCVIEGHGALVVERAPAAVKQQIDVWGGTRGDFELMRRLKAQFDPQRTLNQGRFLGGL